MSSRTCSWPELEFVGGNRELELGFVEGFRVVGILFAAGLKSMTNGDLDLETIDEDRDEERDLRCVRHAGGGTPGARS